MLEGFCPWRSRIFFPIILESQFGLSPSHSVAREGSDRLGLVLFCTLSSVEYAVWWNVECSFSSLCLRGNQDIERSTWIDWLLYRGNELPMTSWRLCPVFVVCSCGSFQGYRRCTNFEAIQVQGVSAFILPGFALLWHWFWGSSRLDIIPSYQMLSILMDMFLCSSLFQELIVILPGRWPTACSGWQINGREL